MAKSSNKTKKPTGLAITRSGNNYTCSWKIGDSDYGNGQQFQYTTNGVTWTSVTVTATATSYVLSNQANLTYLQFKVCGNRKKYKKNGKSVNPGWSDWTASGVWRAAAPRAPKIEYVSITANSGKFVWETETKTDDAYVFDNVVIQKQLRRDNTVNPTTGTWTNVTGSAASGEVTVTEQPEDIAAGPFIRWVRIQSKGNAGSSAWVYASHAYGAPSTPTLLSASAETVGTVSRITAQWSTARSLMNPIDTVKVQYVIDKPTDVTLTAPANGWVDAIEFAPSDGTDKIVVNVEDVIAVDECMWVRIVTTHDDINSYSDAMVAQIGVLKAPTINAVPDTTNGSVAITITEETACTVAKTAIFYRDESDPSNDRIIGVFAHGTTTGTISISDIIGKSTTCFGAFAFVGSSSGLIIDPLMRSDSAIDSDIVAVAPATVTITEGPRDETARIGWSWSWGDALQAELAWSEHEEAWESTDEPSTYTVVDKGASSWVIAGLETGKKYFFRVRLIGEVDNEEVIGPWSKTVTYEVTGVPDRPVLSLNKTVIGEGESVTARWAYGATVGTEQAYAEICLVTFEEDDNDNTVPVYGDVIAHTDVDQSIEIKQDWTTGTTYYFAVRITTTSGMQTEWSDAVGLNVAAPATIAITQSSISPPAAYYVDITTHTNTYVNDVLTDMTVDMEQETHNVVGGMTSALYETLYTPADDVTVTVVVNGDTKTVTTVEKVVTFSGGTYLKTMPLTVTVTGAGTFGTTIVAIERAENYHVDRPDEKDFDGYVGETIVSRTQQGEAQMTINVDDLIGSLDDGGKYNLVATIIDEHGQSASYTMPFAVNWTHKAWVPSAEVTVDKYLRIAKIKPVATTSVVVGDKCDIYRITADQPELIYKGATFGETYVDPYPAFGDACGHRIVMVTANGCYTSASGLAWYDTSADDGDFLDEQQMIIDVDGNQIALPYNIKLSNRWTKDFKRTSYLGGSVRGDWNPAVTRDLTAETVLVRGDDLDKQLAMRDLAGYAGVAHIRTPDGSSLTCDIQIDEQQGYNTKKVSYTLTILAIDPGDPVGMTLTEWESMQGE